MALPTYLQLAAAGDDAPILFGEDTIQHTVGDVDVGAMIECTEFEVAMTTGQLSAGRVTGKRAWQPARFVLRVGKSTPWLFEAARANRVIELTLHFFHPHHETGAIEQHLQYRIQQGRIVSLRLVQPDALRPDTASLREYVELQVLPTIVEVESMTGGTTVKDDWLNVGR